MLVDQERPMVPTTEHNRPEMTKVPGQNRRGTLGGDCHHSQIREIHSRVTKTLRKIESKRKFAICGRDQTMDALVKAPPEGRRGGGVAASAKEQVDLDEDGPGNQRVSAEPGEEARCEPVAPAFRAIDGRENGTRVADGHARTRARISSTLRERSGSSSINPA